MLGQAGVRCIYPLPSLVVDACAFTFSIASDSPHGPILPAGTFAENGIPNDFFGNPSWGIYVRKAFAYAFDYDTFLANAFSGEGTHPATVIIPGLPYFDPSVVGYTYDPAKATEEFQQVPGLWNTGFTITFLYSSGSQPPTFENLMKQGIEALNPKFHVNTQLVT